MNFMHTGLLAAFVLSTATLAFGQQSPATTSDRRLQRLERWLASKDESQRVQAVRELKSLNLPAARDLLLKAIRDPSPEVRALAAWNLGAYKERPVIESLRPVLRDENDRVRAAAAWGLCTIGDRIILPDIIKVVQEDTAPVARFRALWGLAFLGDRSALPVAINALTDLNNSVRERSALLAIEALRDQTVPERVRALAQHPYADTRRIVMYLLAKYPARENIPVLQNALADTDPIVRGEAALSLGKIKAYSARDKLVAALQDSDDHVRGAAAYALGLIGDKAAVPDLRKVAGDESGFVRAVAAESLNRLGDQSVKPPEGFRAVEMFTYPIHSPEHTEIY